MVRKKYRDQIEAEAAATSSSSSALMQAVSDEDMDELEGLEDVQTEGDPPSTAALSSSLASFSARDPKLALMLQGTQSDPSPAAPRALPPLVPKSATPTRPETESVEAIMPSPTAGMLDELDALDSMSPRALLNTPTARAEASKRAAFEETKTAVGARALAMQRLEQRTGQDLDGDGAVGRVLARPPRPAPKATPMQALARPARPQPAQALARPARPQPAPPPADDDDEDDMLGELAGLDDGSTTPADEEEEGEDEGSDDDMLASLAELDGM